ncbi:MAG: CHRD domain-containing protein [Solirubrobacterales bacterium]|nr:CHRD domain-containing protein [Solirubrobacterales bacterium]
MSKRLLTAGATACAVALATGVAFAPAHEGRSDDRGHRGDDRERSERVLLGVLNGRNEIGPDGRKGAGDPDGQGTASAVIDGDQLCFGLTVKNLGAPAAAHIHRGRKDVNGPVVITLTAPQAGDPGASSGCVAVAGDLARDLLRHPNRFYWNVHTAEFPGGAIRDQVFAKRG